jgi:hypothetical protein
MTLSISAEARARLTTIPPASMAPTPSPAVFRRTFRPYGRGGASFTLSLFDSGAPHPAGGQWLGYRLHHHSPGGPRRGALLFAGADLPPPEDGDLAVAARDVLERLTVRPGDLTPDPTAGYNPDQLTFAVRDAQALREVVRSRLGWRPEVPFNPRADLEAFAAYSSRALQEGGRRHRVRVGVVQAEGATRRAAVEALAAALGNHCSVEPEFIVGPYTSHVYALVPHGADWALYVVEPETRHVSPPARFGASSVDEARAAFDGAVQRMEARHAPPKRYARPSARAQAAA